MGNFNLFLLFPIFIAVNLSAGVAALSCPTAFELHGHRCYKALDLHASWPEAKEYCKILGGKLVAIASAYEQDIISRIMSRMHGIITNGGYWIDGSDMLSEREWRWMGDHGASVPFRYSFWAPGQPDTTKERCVEIVYAWNYKWNNVHCYYTRSVICEARATATEGEIVNDILQDP
ncbi:hypothetical protein ACJMK2_001097 [Sinanodonta woodiana]|uniref:C-type lectin domain-containing protein n=1 Tax=Sinanodonta woodiana TaxID=1069815 RepID=A0ABD3XR81_SINWO